MGNNSVMMMIITAIKIIQITIRTTNILKWKVSKNMAVMKRLVMGRLKKKKNDDTKSNNVDNI